MNRATRRWLARHPQPVTLDVRAVQGPPVPDDWYHRHKPTTIRVGELVITIPAA